MRTRNDSPSVAYNQFHNGWENGTLFLMMSLSFWSSLIFCHFTSINVIVFVHHVDMSIFNLAPSYRPCLVAVSETCGDRSHLEKRWKCVCVCVCQFVFAYLNNHAKKKIVSAYLTSTIIQLRTITYSHTIQCHLFDLTDTTKRNEKQKKWKKKTKQNNQKRKNRDANERPNTRRLVRNRNKNTKIQWHIIVLRYLFCAILLEKKKLNLSVWTRCLIVVWYGRSAWVCVGLCVLNAQFCSDNWCDRIIAKMS